MRKKEMLTASVQTVITLALLGRFVQHAKTQDLYMSRVEIESRAGKLRWFKIGTPGVPGGNQ
jgi:hypothetical protein